MCDGIHDLSAQLVFHPFEGVVCVASLNLAPGHADTNGADAILLGH